MERWLPIIGYEKSYEISDQGNVHSIDRYRRNKHGVCLCRGKPLKWKWVGGRPERRYAAVNLYSEDRPTQHLVHLLVLTHFVGPRPEGTKGLHRDDDTQHNWLANLYWGTPEENWEDRRRNRNMTSVRGVTWSTQKQRWRVTIKNRHVGFFKVLEEAELAARNHS